MLERFKQRSRFSCVIFCSCNLPNNESHGKSLCGRRNRFLQHIMVIKLGLSHTILQNRKFKLFLIFSTLGAKINRPQPRTYSTRGQLSDWVWTASSLCIFFGKNNSTEMRRNAVVIVALCVNSCPDFCCDLFIVIYIIVIYDVLTTKCSVIISEL